MIVFAIMGRAWMGVWDSASGGEKGFFGAGGLDLASDLVDCPLVYWDNSTGEPARLDSKNNDE